jgi:hypothetical protein
MNLVNSSIYFGVALVALFFLGYLIMTDILSKYKDVLVLGTAFVGFFFTGLFLATAFTNKV